MITIWLRPCDAHHAVGIRRLTRINDDPAFVIMSG